MTYVCARLPLSGCPHGLDMAPWRSPSRTTASSATCIRRRSSAATARSTGCACPASTRPRASPSSSGRRERLWRIAPEGRRSGQRTAATGTTPSCSRPSSRPTRAPSASSTACRIREQHPEVVRVVEGVTGKVAMRMDLIIRFDYGHDRAVGPPARRPAPRHRRPRRHLARGPRSRPHGEDLRRSPSSPSPRAQQRARSSLGWFPSYEEPPRPVDADVRASTTPSAGGPTGRRQCTYRASTASAVLRSLITLKALTYAPTGGIVAAPPRRCPRRSAACATGTTATAGCATRRSRSSRSCAAATTTRRWRGATGCCGPSPATRPQLQIMYGPAGERRLDECELDWLPGYEGSTPVRIGNAAAGQFQLDVYGEVMSALYESCQPGDSRRRAGVGPPDRRSWTSWRRAGRSPTTGSGRCAGPRRHFTHSKVMAWVAFDRAIKSVEQYRRRRPARPLAQARASEIHDEVCDEGLRRRARDAFTQYYGSDDLDASLLMIPLVGFLPAHDPRVRGTIEAIERELLEGRLRPALRHRRGRRRRRPAGREGAFLPARSGSPTACPCSGGTREPRSCFERLIGLRNDLGLLSEEYDPVARPPGRQLPAGVLARLAWSTRRQRSAGTRSRPPTTWCWAWPARPSVATGRPRPVGT